MAELLEVKNLSVSFFTPAGEVQAVRNVSFSLRPGEVLARVLEGASRTGKVYLVGAGCGAADLITVRGLRLLERCGAVVYDDLLSPELLDAAPEGAERIYAGKRRGRHSMAQEEINALLAAKAREGKMVVRLKGGDPFVFGRGGEEALALQAAGVP